MTSATLTGDLFPTRPVTRDRPAPWKLRAPVFIQDAITPWNGETLLLTLLRAQALEDDPS